MGISMEAFRGTLDTASKEDLMRYACAVFIELLYRSELEIERLKQKVDGATP